MRVFDPQYISSESTIATGHNGAKVTNLPLRVNSVFLPDIVPRVEPILQRMEIPRISWRSRYT